MIGYITLGSNNFEQAVNFYDKLMAELGAVRIMNFDGCVSWGCAGSKGINLVLMKPENGEPATVGNGVMVALSVDSPDKVDQLYQKAIELGATCEGKPGLRYEPGFYVGYFRDLDGNKLNAFHIQRRK